MSKKPRLAVAQTYTLSTTPETLLALEQITKKAQSKKIDLLLFPEAYLGGYPRTATFGASVGARKPEGREQFLAYFKDAVDLGDTPEGAGERWVRRSLPTKVGDGGKDEGGKGKGVRGDGTREELERIARETGVYLVVGCVERCGGTLYCGVVYVCPKEGMVGKRRKVMPTGSERLIWGQGQPSSLRAVTTVIKGTKITLAAAICWENYMPLLRQSLYSQNVNLYLAPTADARESWEALMKTVAAEGRCVVLSANQCVREGNLPAWIRGKEDGGKKTSTNGTVSSPAKLRRKSTTTKDEQEIALPDSVDGKTEVQRSRRKSVVTADGHEIALPDTAEEDDNSMQASKPKGKGESSEFVCRGGSCIISPLGEVLEGPLWDDDDGLLFVDVDFDDCLRGRLDLDVGGSYSRNDSFKLTVEGLDLSPPP